MARGQNKQEVVYVVIWPTETERAFYDEAAEAMRERVALRIRQGHGRAAAEATVRAQYDGENDRAYARLREIEASGSPADSTKLHLSLAKNHARLAAMGKGAYAGKHREWAREHMDKYLRSNR
jgi:hypothetical protein